MMDRLARRRETNRKSQQRSRDAKEAQLRALHEENERLRAQVQAGSTEGSLSSRQLSGFSPSFESTIPSSVSSGPHVQTPLPNVTSLDLEACRQAFLAVLASVCDPHLNTIHAVCAKFSQSRGHAPEGPDLYPPRPVNRPLQKFPQDTTWSEADLQQLFGPSISALDFTDLIPSTAYIPPPGFTTGPLSVPFLEPQHPVLGIELDAGDVWSFVMGIVDMSKTDAEALAARIVPKVRCYGYGPVLSKSDVEAVCDTFPLLVAPAT